MIEIDAALLRRCYPLLNAPRADTWAPHIQLAVTRYAINTPERLAAFLAQIGHESGQLRYTKEIWGPTAAQLRYQGRTDLGNTEAGDGYTYRGRGLIQITGRNNYRAAGDGMGLPLITSPALLEQPEHAAASAAWWWQAHGCNEIADSGDFVRLTKRINGGINGLDDRRMLWGRAKDAIAARVALTVAMPEPEIGAVVTETPPAQQTEFVDVIAAFLRSLFELLGKIFKGKNNG